MEEGSWVFLVSFLCLSIVALVVCALQLCCACRVPSSALFGATRDDGTRHDAGLTYVARRNARESLLSTTGRLDALPVQMAPHLVPTPPPPPQPTTIDGSILPSPPRTTTVCVDEREGNVESSSAAVAQAAL